MITVGIREFKARLSSYVRRVRAGGVVMVTDRGQIVAELRPPNSVAEESVAARRYREAVASGWIQPPAAPNTRSWLDEPGAGLPRGTGAALLDAERGSD